MATGNVGSISITVLPDLTRFRSALRKQLHTVEEYYKRNPLDVSVQLHAEFNDRELKTEAARAKKKIENTLEDVEATVNADADTEAAKLKLTWLTRPRKVHVGTVFEDTGGVGKLLAAFSGVQSLDKTAGVFRDLANNIDLVAVKTAAAYGAVSLLSGVMAGGAAGVINFGGGLAKAAKASIVLPSMLTGTAASVTALVLALKDSSKVLGDLKPKFTAIQDLVSAKFWAQAEKPIRSLAENTLPLITQKMGELGDATGIVVGRIAETVENSAAVGHMSTLFNNTRVAVEKSATGLGDMTDAIGVLGAVGSQYLPDLADWFNDISRRFNNFIHQAATDGSLQRWVDDGLQGLRDLGNVIRNIGSIFAGLYEAVKTAGGGMSGLVEQTALFAQTVNKPEFQTGLATILDGARKSASGLKDGLADVGAAIGDMAPLVSDMLATVGIQVGKLGSAIAEALHDPQVQSGLDSIRKGFKSLSDMIVRLVSNNAPLIGTFLDTLGKVAQTVGTLLGGALQTVAPFLQTFLDLMNALPAPLLATVGLFTAFRRGFLGLPELIKDVSGAFKVLKTNMEQQVRGYENGFNAIRTAAKKTGAALRTAFVSNAPLLALSVITSAIGYFAGKTQEAKQKQDDLRNSLDQTTGALTDQTAEFYTQNEDLKDAANTYVELGGSLEDFYGRLMGNAEATERFNAVLDEHKQKIELTAGAFNDATGSSMMAYDDGVKQVTDTVNETIEAQRQAQEEVRNHAAAQEAAKTALDNASMSAETQTQKLQALLDKQRELAGINMNADRAALNYQQTLDRVSASLEVNAGVSAMGTEAQKKNLDSLLQLVDAGLREVDALQKQDASGVAAAATQANLAIDFLNTARQMGLTAAEAVNLGKKYGLIPENINTKAIFDNNGALRDVDTVKRKIASIPSVVTTVHRIEQRISTTSDPMAKQALITAMNRYADGGFAFANGGIVKFFAGGAENHVAQIAPAGAYRVWAESETGGEAYIPLSPAKRTRSLQILKDTANRFGYGIHEYADGSGFNTNTGMGAVYNVNVNVEARELRDMVSVADFIDKLGYRTRMGAV